MKRQEAYFILTFIAFLLLNLFSPSKARAAEAIQDLKAKVEKGVANGLIAYRLTDPEEFKSFFGPPLSESETRDGGMLILKSNYPHLLAVFGKVRDDPAPFVLLEIWIDGKKTDIGEEKKIILRNLEDLTKIDRFWGFENLSLVRLDLRSQSGLLDSMNYDSLTEWPPEDKLPPGFDPTGLLENAKNPGLGIRSLHEMGIDGRGVGMAIIDQPLLLGHVEYTARLARYDATGLLGMPPQMHGSPVASIAVGKKIGVAPCASLTYFAVPMWERDNSPYIEALKKIFGLNQTLPETEKIRVISISTGMFEFQSHYEEWKKALEQAEGLGILVVTCDQAVLKYGTLDLSPGLNPDDVLSYKAGKYAGKDDQLRIPAGGRALASYRGDEVYTFYREGGMSWAAPYIAGLAALAFQTDPEITPSLIIRCLVETATETEAGPVVNPIGFIEKIKETKNKEM